MIPHKTIEDLINKHSSLEKDLSSGKIDKKLFAEKSKEYSDLNDILEVAKKYISFEKDKTELEKILQDQNNDQEFKKMAESELKMLEKTQRGYYVLDWIFKQRTCSVRTLSISHRVV